MGELLAGAVKTIFAMCTPGLADFLLNNRYGIQQQECAQNEKRPFDDQQETS